jgi:preprotein translocase subunit SecB
MAEKTEQQVEIHRIYTKDISLETPESPSIFTQEWRPDISLDLNVKHQHLDKEFYEVVLTVTTHAKMKDKTAFLAEVHQAGIFYVKGFAPAEQDHFLSVYCPSVLYPYAREAIASLIGRASFPPLILTPVNFDVLYHQQKQQQGDKTH